MMEKDEEKEMKELEDFEDNFLKGIYAVPEPKCLPRYSPRRIMKYMKETGKKGPLSDEELQQFRSEPKGFICRAVKTVEEATHWFPTINNQIGECEVTPFQLYQIFYDKYHDEHLIIVDSKEFSLIYMWHAGRFVVVEQAR